MSTETGLAASVHARLLPAGVTPGFFEVLGVLPMLGRTPGASDARSDGSGGVVLGYNVWRNHFGADPRILGRLINVNGSPLPVTWVMPPGFSYPEGVELWSSGVAEDEPRSSRYLQVIGRLRANVSWQQAQAQMSAIAKRLAEQYASTNRGRTVRVISFEELAEGEFRLPLLLLLAAATSVLLLACINATNLLLARVIARKKEIAVRIALGVDQGRILRHFLAESLLLSLLGGILGLAVASVGVRAFVVLAPGNLPRIAETTIDYRVLAFTSVLSILSCVLCGLVPAVQATRHSSRHDLYKESRRNISLPLRRVRSALVIVQFALSSVLRLTAVSLITSFINVQRVDLGFVPEKLLTVRIMVPRTEAERLVFFQEVIRRIQSVPQVHSVAATDSPPLGGGSYPGTDCAFIPAGRRLVPEEESYAVSCLVTPGYFQTIGIRLLAGRSFDWQDDRDHTVPVAVVNRALAKRFGSIDEALGRKLTIWRSEKFPRQIVGVVEDAIGASREAPIPPTIYLPYSQMPVPSLTLFIRTVINPTSLVAAVRQTVRSVDPNLPLYQIFTMDQLLARSISERLFLSALLTILAVIAFILATAGIYGLMRYVATQRTREIGIRIALGAPQGDVARALLRQAFILVAVGLVSGVPFAWLLRDVLRSMLYYVSPTDLTVLLMTSLLLASTGLVASYLPIRQAIRSDPVAALRSE